MSKYKLFESKINAIRIEIPYETYEKDTTTGYFNSKKIIKGKSKIIDFAGRKIVVFNVGGINVPFYLSTGLGGKKGVPTGKWYPFLGIGSDGWFNKSSSLMVKYFDIDILRQISQSLDVQIGNTKDKNIPSVKSSGIHIDCINKNLEPTDHEMSYTISRFYKNLERFKKLLSEINV